uniref:Uncharacterized protein n=1 Tax=Meloidogyne enterolobii TaxID=390850 RepID=A0A6V7VHW5_MELEN|nr:unnamed protein product [Meloidogyne enterolobii]
MKILIIHSNPQFPFKSLNLYLTLSIPTFFAKLNETVYGYRINVINGKRFFQN